MGRVGLARLNVFPRVDADCNQGHSGWTTGRIPGGSPADSVCALMKRIRKSNGKKLRRGLKAGGGASMTQRGA